jgi:hypothetical protein
VSAAASPLPSVDTLDDLRALGFEGFLTIAALREAPGEGVPVAPGAWVVLRESPGLPHFLASSTGADWRGQDPTVSADTLGARWVANARILYVGAAPGLGVRALLQQRIKRFVRFGQGRRVAHWSGRYVWQLAGSAALRVAWRVTPAQQARGAADQVLAAFAGRHGMPPFANEPGAPEE